VCALTDYRHDPLKADFEQILDRNGLKLKDLAQALRVAFTGRTVSPPIFDTLALLGRDQVAVRLQPWI
jgi:glutamyl-tRNA synthetase